MKHNEAKIHQDIEAYEEVIRQLSEIKHDKVKTIVLDTRKAALHSALVARYGGYHKACRMVNRSPME